MGAAWTPKVCRLCLAQTTVCFSLIEDSEASGMLEALTSLRILPTDEISTVMCLKCRLNLKLAFSIQQNMLKAEQRFKEYQLPVQIKVEVDDEIEQIEVDDTQLQEDSSQIVRQLIKDVVAQTYRCDICDVPKSTKRQLQLHNYNVHKSKRCPECAQDVKLNAFKEHLERHRSEERPLENLSCDICGIVKVTRKLLRHHFYNVHATKKCPECGADVKLSTFKEHLESHDSTISHVCDVCGMVKSSKRNLSHHKYNVHTSKKCPKCDKDVKLTKFKHHVDSHRLAKVKSAPEKKPASQESAEEEEEEEKVEMDEKKDGGAEIFSCNFCGCTKSSRRNLQHHMYSVHKFRKCHICNKIIKSSYFARHVGTHSDRTTESGEVKSANLGGKYPCDVCDAVKDSKTELARHKYILHMDSKCPICEKQIKTVNIRRHIERHKNIRTVCEICGTTMNSHDLNSHMHYAHGQRDYKCQYCDKVYKKKQSLMAHEKREHLKKADFVCDTCGKRFHARLHLKKHINSTHLKLRPFICEFCKVGFSSRFSLRTHRRQHTNETPYKCEFCTEGFRQNVSLRAHLKSKHGVREELTCECPTCGKKFGSSAALIAHGRIH